MSPISVALLVLASVVFYVGSYHLLFYARTRERREILAFALTCFTITLYDLLCSALYGARLSADAAFWQTRQELTLSLFGICMVWFVSDITNQKHKSWDFLFYGYWLCEIVLLFTLPEAATWRTHTAWRSLTFFGHTISYPERDAGPLVQLQDIVGILACIYMVTQLWRRYRQGYRRETGPVLLGIFAVSVSLIHDTCHLPLASSGFIRIEYAFILLPVAMAYAFTSFHSEIRSALRLSQNELTRLAAALHSAGESIIITDPDGIMIYVNPAFERALGLTRDEVIGQSTAMLKSGHHSHEFYSELWKVISSGKTWHGVFLNRRKDGSIIEQQATISPVLDAAGQTVNYVAVERDVTQEHTLEDQVRQSQKMAAVGQLAHRVAHDCTNVLVRVMGNAELARMHTQPNTEISRHLDEIVSAAHSMAEITSALLSFSHPGPPSFKPARLRNVLSGLTTMIKSSVAPGVTVAMEDDGINPRVMIDQNQIEQALMHLILNSSDAMPDGGALTLQTSSVKPEHPLHQLLGSLQKQKGTVVEHEFAALIIKDTGMGMDSDTLAKIFEPFFTTKMDRKSAGLGLSTVYTIVENHHGFMVVESEPNAGTKTTIFLPTA